MSADAIERILVVGAGTMGQQIALQCALAECEVRLYDIASESLARAESLIARIGKGYVRDDLIEAPALEAALSRISYHDDLATCSSGIDVVSESVFEDVELKRTVWAQIGEAVGPDAILTTNTSTLRPSDFAEATGHPERFLAWHFHLPTYTAPIVDVMPHPGTDEEVTETMVAFSRRIRQIPILITKEHPEYVFNTMLVALLSAAQRLAIGQVASVEDIDRSWMGVTGMDIGPFGIMDIVGLDTIAHVTRSSLRNHPGDPRLEAALAWITSYTEHGKLGLKSGQGFYAYPEPAFREEAFLSLNDHQEHDDGE